MATKRAAKKTNKKSKKTQDVQLVLTPDQKEALKLLEKSAKARDELEQAVTLAAAKAVRKVMKDHKVSLTPPEASELAAILFGE